MNREETIKEIITFLEERAEDHEVAHENAQHSQEQLVHSVRVHEVFEIINGLQALLSTSKVIK